MFLIMMAGQPCTLQHAKAMQQLYTYCWMLMRHWMPPQHQMQKARQHYTWHAKMGTQQWCTCCWMRRQQQMPLMQ
jgi:hypothetical protein